MLVPRSKEGDHIKWQTAKLIGGPHHDTTMLVQTDQQTLDTKCGHQQITYHRIDDHKFACESLLSFTKQQRRRRRMQ